MEKQIRNLTYGYSIENGQFTVNATEAIEVKKIFMSYLNGQSYKTIADKLTKEKVEYLPLKSDWNKNRVKRVLENPKYLGTPTLPPLISETEFATVQKIISSKTANKAEPTQDTTLLKGHIKCGECGKNLKKYITHKRDAWICDCKVSVTAKTLNLETARLLSEVKQQDTLLYQEHQKASESELQFIQKTISSELKEELIDEDKIKTLIFSYATAQYNNIQYQDESVEDDIKSLISNSGESDIAILTQITKHLIVYQDHHLGAVLITGKQI